MKKIDLATELAQLKADQQRLAESGWKDEDEGRRRWNVARTVPPHKHGGVPTAKLVSTCWPCAEKRIRRMAEMPQGDHRGRNGRRLAEIYGVEFIPYESRTPAEQAALTSRYLKRTAVEPVPDGPSLY